ncbi:MAG: hypothetical protein FWG87_05215 [Defluviitaleaceae bacterium]|nr:hypothetical protein [Defluviitaleaceae bacterium]
MKIAANSIIPITDTTKHISVLDDIEHAEIAELVAERKANDNGKRYSLNDVLSPYCP